MSTAWVDLRIAVRRLWRAPGFTIGAVGLLAVSIGGAAFVFSTVRGLLLQAIPYAGAERLAVLSPAAPRWEFFEELRDTPGAFEQVGAYTQRAANLGGHGPAERVLVGRVTPGFLQLTGTRPQVGRLFGGADFTPPDDRVAVITDRLWRRRYAGAAADAIGESLTLDGLQYTIVGVLPATFRTVQQLERAHDAPFDREVSLLIPLPDRPAVYDPTSTDKVWHGLTVVGRLRGGMSVEQANQELSPLLARAQMRYQFPVPFAFISLQESAAAGLPRQLALLSLAIAFFFLVGGANVANLVLGRIEGRRRELAVCTAIGSDARHIVSSVLAETLLLSSAGGALGLLLAWQSIAALRILAAGGLDVGGIAIDRQVTFFTIAVTLATGVLVGLGPALRHARTNPAAVLQRPVTGPATRGGFSFTSALVVSQVALSVVLVVVGALLARTFVRAVSVNPGFSSTGVLTAEISLDRSGYWLRNSTRFFGDLLERLTALPGVRDAALVSAVPGGQFDSVTGVTIRGRVHVVDSGLVSPSYFSVLSIPMIAGGGFTEQDTRQSPYVVVVNEAFARMHWDTPARAIGRTIAMGTRSTGSVVSGLEWTIVGVVADARDVAAGAAPRPKVYWSYKQGSSAESTQMTLLVRSASGDAGVLAQPLTRLVRDINPDQPLYNVLPLDTILRWRFARERTMAAVMNGFAVLTLLVALLGVHAAMAYAGALRRHEVGVRLALGGSRMAVLRLLAWRGAKQVLVGIELGIFLSVVFVAVFQSWIFGAGGADPVTMAGAVALVTATSAVALLAPAWRATRIDPIEMLRAQ